MTSPLNLDLLLKLRLVVARHGEMDGARWWNTNGVLGSKGAQLLGRGFPKTHRFAQARLVFEAARTRSEERFANVPGCFTLWNLPATLEEEFDAQWPSWLDDSDSWSHFFNDLHELGDDLLGAMRVRELIEPRHEDLVSGMRRSAEGRSVPLSGVLNADTETVTLLAAAFSRGEVGKPAIPYARMEG